jgi:hypothetical protein
VRARSYIARLKGRISDVSEDRIIAFLRGRFARIDERFDVSMPGSTS